MYIVYISYIYCITYHVYHITYQISPVLTLIYCASISQGTVPSDWKLANVVPIFKKGSKSCPSNYRPVSLTSICCKILEHIIYSSIWHHLEDHNIICDKQHGFRSGHSCETQLLMTIHYLAQNLNNQKQTDVILLDFTKAFDKVSHKRLCPKLAHYGIRGALLTWINDFLTGRTQRVTVNGCISDDTRVTSGVPQGTVLAPLLFLVYITDLPKNIVSSVKLYADDVLIYRTINSEQDHMILQQDLNMLQKWADTWLMTFNPTKCEFIRVSHKKHPRICDYYIQEHPIKVVTHAKYLGVTIDEHLSFNEHVNRIAHKANTVKAFLQRNITSCPLQVKENCYRIMVRPIMEYACTVWSPHTKKNIQILEAVQRRAARFVKNDYSNFSSVTAMMQDLEWPTLEERRWVIKVTMLFKILNDIVCIPADQYLVSISITGRRHQQRLKLKQDPFFNVNAYMNSFFPSAIDTWNKLPDTAINAANIHDFKDRLTHNLFNQYNK